MWKYKNKIIVFRFSIYFSFYHQHFYEQYHHHPSVILVASIRGPGPLSFFLSTSRGVLHSLWQGRFHICISTISQDFKQTLRMLWRMRHSFLMKSTYIRTLSVTGLNAIILLLWLSYTYYMNFRKISIRHVYLRKNTWFK